MMGWFWDHLQEAWHLLLLLREASHSAMEKLSTDPQERPCEEHCTEMETTCGPSTPVLSGPSQAAAFECSKVSDPS